MRGSSVTNGFRPFAIEGAAGAGTRPWGRGSAVTFARLPRPVSATRPVPSAAAVPTKSPALFKSSRRRRYWSSGVISEAGGALGARGMAGIVAEFVAAGEVMDDDAPRMKVLIVGATGPTGRELVAEVLDAGHEVRAFARNPSAVGAWSPRLEVVQGDVLVWGNIGPAMRGMDAVLSVLGTGGDLAETTIFSEGTAAILWAMAESGVRRLVCVTSSGTVEDPNESFLERTLGRHAMSAR